MFCFITPIRSQHVSADWERVSELFERTAWSVFNQTDRHFRLLAVIHERPVLRSSFDERLEFLTATHPVPAIGFDSLLLGDKVPKLRIALARAGELGARFVMPLDADDLVSRHLVEFVRAQSDGDGWYVLDGWKHCYGSPWIEPISEFNRICGSCNILNLRRLLALRSGELSTVGEMLFSAGHDQIVPVLGSLGLSLKPIPFRAATYVVGNGENFSTRFVDAPPRYAPRSILRSIAGRALRRITHASRLRPLTSPLRTEFSINGSLAA